MTTFQPIAPVPIIATTCLESDRYHCRKEDASHAVHCNDCHTLYETYDGPNVRRALRAAEESK